MILQRNWKTTVLLIIIFGLTYWYGKHFSGTNARGSNYNSKWADYDIVISRYDEVDFPWIYNITSVMGFPTSNIFIYNKKNDSFDIKTFPNNVKLDNIGKCDQSYLSHVIRNYDTLNEYTLFLTPRYRDHIQDSVAAQLNSTLDLFKFCDTSFWSYTPAEYFSPNCKAVYYMCSDYRLTGYHGATLKANKDNLTFGEWMKKYIEPEIDDYVKKGNFRANMGGNFCNSRKRIQSRPLSFYKKLMEQFDANDSEIAHYFERAWYYIFNVHKA